jgi:D-galactarolactone isomerase
MHFYDSSYRAAESATLFPPDATVGDYRQVQAALGLDRVVVVQPSTYGLDNTCQLDAMAAFGSAARGVMVVNSRTPRSELASMTEAGVRGARFHMLPGGAVPWSELEPTAALVAEFDWHIQLQLDGNTLGQHVDRLRSLPTPLVVDHVGRFMPPPAPADPAFRLLVELVDEGRTWVKLSAPYESTGSTADPSYPSVSPLAESLVAAAPDRLLWATNWPHPGQSDAPTIDQVRSLLDQWLPTPELRRQVLVTNPAMLYQFD